MRVYRLPTKTRSRRCGSALQSLRRRSRNGRYGSGHRQRRSAGSRHASRFDAAIAARHLLLARLFGLGLFAGAGEFDERERRGVAPAHAELYHARVAARAILEARGDLVEELLDCVARLHEGERQPTRRKVAALAQRDHAVRVTPQFLGLGVGRFNPLMLDQAQHQVAEQCLAMRRGAVELAALIEMTHRLNSTRLAKPLRPTRAAPALPTCGRVRCAKADFPDASRATTPCRSALP